MTVLPVAAIAVALLAASADPSAKAVEVAEVGVEPQGSLGSLEAEQATLFARVAPSVVLLMRDGISGSGFVVGQGGLVLTNAHVVGAVEEVTVRLVDGRYGLGRVIARTSGALDLALVKIPFDDLPPLLAGDPGALRAGSFAATVGHGGGAAWTFSTGLIANPRPLGDGAPLVLAQMALRPGSSGGPLVDRLGRAVAVVTSGTRDASGVTFAIRIDAAIAAFPQLEPWAASPVRRGAPPALQAGQDGRPDPAAAVARSDPDRATEVAQLAGEGAAARPGRSAEREPGAAAMVTVWEAHRAVRRVAARPPPALRATVPSHGLAQPPLAPAPSLPWPFILAPLALMAVSLAAVRSARIAGPAQPEAGGSARWRIMAAGRKRARASRG